MEDHIYHCIYDIQQSDITPETKLAALNRYKANLVHLQVRRMEKLKLDTNKHNTIDGEEPTLFHMLKTMKRHKAQTILQVKDQSGRIIDTLKDIAHTFILHMQEKYGPIEVAESCVARMIDALQTTDQSNQATHLEQPITSEELYTAIQSGGRNKAPGSDGIGREFYITHWDTIREDLLEIMNQMFLHKSLTTHQKHGIIISLPKNNGDQTLDGYHPITLLNTDYKILTRIMARRLSTVLEEQLTSSQYCSVPGKSILEAVSVICDVIANAEVTRTLICVLSLDFWHAFDRMSHHYLLQILTESGISQWFIDCIHALYEHATASVQINGALAGPIPIQSTIRQGCPLSMALYTLSPHPLSRTQEGKLTGVKLGRRRHSISVVAYADDITVIVTNPTDIEIICHTVRTCEQATEAQLNPRKSKALALGGWLAPISLMGIELYQQVKILGVMFGSTLEMSTNESWTSVINMARAQARKAYNRNLCLTQ
jgi:hypothetical protein